MSPSSASALPSLGFCICEVRRSDRNQVWIAVQTGRGAWGQVPANRKVSAPATQPGGGPETLRTARHTGSPLLLREAGEGLAPSRGSCSDMPGVASGVAGGNGRIWGSRTGFRAGGGRKRGQRFRDPRCHGVRQTRPAAGVGPVPREPARCPLSFQKGPRGLGCPTARTLRGKEGKEGVEDPGVGARPGPCVLSSLLRVRRAALSGTVITNPTRLFNFKLK